jgi:hypothetical protein
MPTLHLTVFWCLDADPSLFRTPAIFTACRSIAKNYGFSLETLPQYVRDPTFVLNFSGDVVGPSEWQRGLQAMFDAANQRVRGLADQAFQGAGRLPIVFGGLNTLGADQLYIGQTIANVSNGGRTYKSDWLPWCVVDPTKAYDRPHALLHEIAHAAGAVHNTSLSAGPGELMVDGDITPPITIEQRVLDLLGQSYFCW